MDAGTGNKGKNGWDGKEALPMRESAPFHYRGKADFGSWKRENLVRFAEEAATEIGRLDGDIKMLLERVRQLTIEGYK